MFGLQQLIRHQVTLGQGQLEDLLLIGSEEARVDVVPKPRLQDLKDHPALSRLGQSFLTDPPNSWLQGHNRWLLNRLLNCSWLQEKVFVDIKQATWRTPTADSYLRRVDRFLERILLLVYMILGQPPRGTELISLQYCNSADGPWRNIFIENGLITFVTFGLKGYNITYESDTSGLSFIPGLIALVTTSIYMDLLDSTLWHDQMGRAITTDELAPIVAMELNIVGRLDGSDTHFTSGAGTINYTAAQKLTVSVGEPTFTHFGGITAETSNIAYGLLPAGYTSNPTQSFRADPLLHLRSGIGIQRGVPLATKRPPDSAQFGK